LPRADAEKKRLAETAQADQENMTPGFFPESSRARIAWSEISASSQQKWQNAIAVRFGK
jgi:hypothetical protein